MLSVLANRTYRHLFLAQIIALVTVVVVTYSAISFAVKVIEDESYFFGLLNVPEWPGKVAFAVGYALFLLQLVVGFFRVFRKESN